MQLVPVPFAVVFKTYFWDDFVHRQALLCEAAAGGGDFYISVDETNGEVGNIPFARVVRTNSERMVRSGFAERFEKGPLLWWNPDYTHYEFQELYPDYSYYVFVEHDAQVRGELQCVIRQISASAVDLVALPIRENKETWCWTAPHRAVYSVAEMQGSLICISVQSSRALKLLAQRRREMSVDAAVTYWPSAEVFMGTEIGRAGYNFRSWKDYGDVSEFSWSPPRCEGKKAEVTRIALLHPVLDRQRYVRWIVEDSFSMLRLLYPGSTLYKALRTYRKCEVLPALLHEVRRRYSIRLLFGTAPKPQTRL